MPILLLGVSMFKAVSRVLFISVILIAFIGQVLAFNTAIPCETSRDSHSFSNTNKSENRTDTIISHTSIDIASSINTEHSDDCCGIDCCDLDCTCMANACSSCIYFTIELDSLSAVASSEVVYIKQSDSPKTITTLLYRPPIFTS